MTCRLARRGIVGTAELHKAAVMLMSLPRSQAGELLAQLDPRQVEAVVSAIAEHDFVTAAEQQTVINDYAHQRHEQGATISGGLQVARALVAEAFRQGIRPGGDLPSRGRCRPFEFLREVDNATCVALLSSELPQTIAVVLAYLPRQRAGELLALLSPALKSDVERRAASLDEVDAESVREVERAMQLECARQFCRRVKSLSVTTAEAAGIVKD